MLPSRELRRLVRSHPAALVRATASASLLARGVNRPKAVLAEAGNVGAGSVTCRCVMSRKLATYKPLASAGGS